MRVSQGTQQVMVETNNRVLKWQDASSQAPVYHWNLTRRGMIVEGLSRGGIRVTVVAARTGRSRHEVLARSRAGSVS